MACTVFFRVNIDVYYIYITVSCDLLANGQLNMYFMLGAG